MSKWADSGLSVLHDLRLLSILPWNSRCDSSFVTLFSATTFKGGAGNSSYNKLARIPRSTFNDLDRFDISWYGKCRVLYFLFFLFGSLYSSVNLRGFLFFSCISSFNSSGGSSHSELLSSLWDAVPNFFLLIWCWWLVDRISMLFVDIRSLGSRNISKISTFGNIWGWWCENPFEFFLLTSYFEFGCLSKSKEVLEVLSIKSDRLFRCEWVFAFACSCVNSLIELGTGAAYLPP